MPSRDPSPKTIDALVGLVAIASILAPLPWLRLGPSGDEVALVQTGAAWRALIDPELGLNPPLWPLLVNGLFPRPWVVLGGRLLALACRGTSVLVAARLTRRLAPDGPWAPLLAVLLLTTSPLLAASGVAFRAYAPLTLGLLMHLDAATALDDDHDDAGQRYAATAALLPWVHYLALPWVLVTGLAVALDPARRPALRRAWPVPLAWAPLVGWIATGGHARTRVGSALALLTDGLGLGWLSGPVWLLLLGLALATVLVAGLRTPVARPTAVGAAAALALLPVVTLVQEVRRPGLALFLAPALPLLAARPGLPRHFALPIALLVLAVIGVFARDFEDSIPEVAIQRSLPDVAHGWNTWKAVAGDEPIGLPARQLPMLSYLVTGEVAAVLPPTQGCPEPQRCFDHDGVLVQAIEGRPSGLVFAPAPPLDSPQASCPELARVGHATLRRCP